MVDRRFPEDEWALRTLLREVGYRFVESWRALTQDARRTFVGTLVLGFALVIGLETVIALIADARIGETPPQIDLAIAKWFDDSSVTITEVRWFAPYGNALVTWPVMFLAAGMAAWRRSPLRALAFIPGYAVTEVITLLGWVLWSRPRPDLLDGPQISWNSFPSGHVVHTVYIFGLFAWLWSSSTDKTGEKLAAWTMFAFVSAGMCAVRIRTMMHWPSDTLAGTLLASAWLGVVIFAIRRAERAEGAQRGTGTP